MDTNLTDANFDQVLGGYDKPVVVDFFATWCGPCTVLGPVLEKVVEGFGGKVVLLKADVNTIPLTSEKFEVDRIPMVAIFNKGKIVGNFIGLRDESFIKDWIEKAVKESMPSEGLDKSKEVIDWSDEYAKKSGFQLNPDKSAVERVVKGLLANEQKYGEKYCPCRRVSGDKEADKKNICPCVYHKDEIAKDGHCFCKLFVK